MCYRLMVSINTNMDASIQQTWPEQVRFMERVLTENRLAHAYAFTGLDQAGKEALIEMILQTLVAEDMNQVSPENIQQTYQRIADKQFPDVYYLKPEGQSLKVDQIRHLKEWLATSPVEANFKMAVIEQADLMNTSAANALLTFLEEPTANVYLILLCPDINKLLPTIQSRVQELNFPRQRMAQHMLLADDQEILTSHQEVLQALPYEISQDILTDYQAETFGKWLEAYNQFYQRLIAKDSLAMVQVQLQLKPFLSVKQSLQGLEYLWLLNYSLLKQDYAATETFSPYFIQQIHQSAQYQVEDVLKLNQYLLNCKQKILANVSPQLAFEQLAIRTIR
ncbi:hypothetical protein [Ignavigranum ruoffiae]|uniref:hypothetical protein n=1 Tax=Ignavigranum ruoffiae TaxID=89093 RepID=UPI0024AE7A05|nr:hypothetical protein [Ignavigranum ruoffiae]